MANLYIMVGIPGSGKSTVAKRYAADPDTKSIIISSDKIRQELYGDKNCQSHNGKVFELAYKRIKENLKNGLDVIFDATNVTIKERKQAIRAGKEAGVHYTIAIVVTPPREICISRDKERNRTVGAEVIDKFIHRFEIPIKQEGFNIIHFYHTSTHEKHEENVADIEKQIQHADDGIFEQTGKYHTENLVSHSLMAMTDPDTLLLTDDPVLCKHMAFLHDYGKLFTRTRNDTGYHFYNHGNVGAYNFISNVPMSDSNYKIAMLMNYHDYTFLYPEKKLDQVFKDYADTLRRFRKIDERSTIPNPVYTKPTSSLSQLETDDIEKE